MPIPTGTLSRVRWDFARAGVLYSLEAITSPGLGTTDSAGAPLEWVMGATLGKAREAGEGQAVSGTRGWMPCFSLGNGKFVLGSAGAWGKPSAFCSPPWAKVWRRSQSQGCQASGRDFKVSLQHRLPQLYDLPPTHGALAVSPVPLGKPWLWKMQEIDPVVTHVYRVVIGMGKHGR